jgi:hypothetical protein
MISGKILILFTVLCYACTVAVLLYYIITDDDVESVENGKNSIIVKNSSDVTIITSDEKIHEND